jgi:xylan 1,4-beta-xylosidase
MNRCFILAILLSMISPAQSPPGAPPPETLHLDWRGPAKPFPHFWETMFGSGRAILSLRRSWRDDLDAVRAATGVQYIRFHGIFDEETGAVNPDGSFNFSYIDQIYDGLLDAGVRPFVELSFMPRALAVSDKPHAFWYKPLPNPPKDYSAWGKLIEAFTRHLIERYGSTEVERWYFEVWNEPNIDFWTGEPKQATYFTLYDHAARAIKSVDAKLRVGGPATAQAAWIPAFIEHCLRNSVPVDFVSTHVYGNDSAEDVFGTHERIPRRDMVARAARKVHEEVAHSARPNLPIIWSEYNATYLNDPNVTDSAFMGPWLANHIRESDGLTQMMSYWCFSDVFEEQGVVKKPFYGGYGLVAAGHIPKAAFNAFQLLHELGDERLELASENALATRRRDGSIALALWNYAEPGENAPDRTFHIEAPGAKTMRVREVSPNSGSALEKWRAMGAPAFPSREQQRTLRDAARMAPAHAVRNGAITLRPQALALVEISR